MTLLTIHVEHFKIVTRDKICVKTGPNQIVNTKKKSYRSKLNHFIIIIKTIIITIIVPFVVDVFASQTNSSKRYKEVVVYGKEQKNKEKFGQKSVDSYTIVAANILSSLDI